MLVLELSIKGGIFSQCVSLFKDIKVKAFVAGYALAREIANAVHKESWIYW